MHLMPRVANRASQNFSHMNSPIFLKVPFSGLCCHSCWGVENSIQKKSDSPMISHFFTNKVPGTDSHLDSEENDLKIMSFLGKKWEKKTKLYSESHDKWWWVRCPWWGMGHRVCVSAMVSTDLEVNMFETNGATYIYIYIKFVCIKKTGLKI